MRLCWQQLQLHHRHHHHHPNHHRHHRHHAGPVAEQVLILENMASSVKTGPDQLASIHGLMIEAVSKPQTAAGRSTPSGLPVPSPPPIKPTA
jgi:hypothetical protein